MPLPYSDTVTTEPTVDPVGLDAARRALDLDDQDRDDEIRAWITEAARKLRHDARVALITETRTRKLHEFPSPATLTRGRYDRGPTDAIVLDSVAPLAGVASIKYYNLAGVLTTLSSAAYIVDTHRRPGVIWLVPGQSWPATQARPNAVEIVYTAGYGASPAYVPQTAKQAILSLVRMRLDAPDEYDPIHIGGAISPQGYEAAVEYLGWGAYP